LYLRIKIIFKFLILDQAVNGNLLKIIRKKINVFLDYEFNFVTIKYYYLEDRQEVKVLF